MLERENHGRGYACGESPQTVTRPAEGASVAPNGPLRNMSGFAGSSAPMPGRTKSQASAAPRLRPPSPFPL